MKVGDVLELPDDFLADPERDAFNERFAEAMAAGYVKTISRVFDVVDENGEFSKPKYLLLDPESKRSYLSCFRFDVR